MRKVLIVEDHATIRLLLRKILERRKDVEVKVASTGEMAETFAQAEPFSLVIMDYHLPRQDGVETVQHIRTLPGYENVPIVMCSAFDVQSRAFEAGCNDFLRKPVTMQMIQETVTKFLGPEAA